MRAAVLLAGLCVLACATVTLGLMLRSEKRLSATQRQTIDAQREAVRAYDHRVTACEAALERDACLLGIDGACKRRAGAVGGP